MVVFEKTFYVGRSKTMKSFVGNDKYFKFNSEINRKPMEICQYHFGDKGKLRKLSRKSWGAEN